MATNQLFYGDNLDILRRYIDDDSVDLVYLDPPFQSGRNYNVLFRERSGDRSAAQIKAFKDTWRWDRAAAEAYTDVVEAGGDVSRAMQGLRMVLGDSDMLAYLAMMAPRLKELRRVLKTTGTIYLHCDPTASHYIKILMDAVWGPDKIRNEIIWCYTSGGVPKRDFARKHDTIFRYVQDPDKYQFNPQYRPYSEGTIERGLTKVKGDKYELREEGAIMQDWWSDIQKVLSPTAYENLGYPTQKPEALLQRIVRASSNEGDLVLDPFCGCGTTISVAQALGRRWIGIDITHLAINLIKHRLFDAYGDNAEYDVIGEPVSLAGAKELAEQDRFQFESWALGLVKARPQKQKKGADKGIDGRLYFHDEPDGDTKQVILQVKSGKTGVKHVRDLRGVIDREDAEIGVLVTLQEPTRPMRKEAASTGFYESPWGKHPRIQIFTVEELLEGAQIDYPPITGSNVTYKKAPRYERKVAEQLNLTDDS